MTAPIPLDWRGVLPAITTPFDDHDAVDHAVLARHATWLLDAGCRAIIALGSLGEGGTLDAAERRAVIQTLVGAVGGRAPIVASVAAISTREAVRQALEAQSLGCTGLMVLPAYVYRGSPAESQAHVGAVIGATPVPCMLYNNPIAYGVDFDPESIAALARRHPNLAAVKESSADIRRITQVRALCGDRLAILAGVDDLIVEAVSAGAVGWVAGLVNALPRESIRLFDLAAKVAAGDSAAADPCRRLYRWFLPLLRLDVVPEFVHLIKLVQAEVGMGSARVRPPRLPLEPAAHSAALAAIRAALAAGAPA